MRLFFNLARGAYKATPIPALRKLYYNLFSYMVRDRHTIATLDGMTFELYLGEVIDLGVYLQHFEHEVVLAIEELCQPGMTVFDIGANIGAHTLRFAKTVGPAGKVFAVEPTEYAYGKLVRNLSLNSFQNTTVFQIALADLSIKQQMINFRSSWRTDRKKIEMKNLVDFERLDDWCQKHSVEKVDLIKTDVDGNEFPILEGGKKIIERCHPVFLMEVVGPHFEDDNKNPFLLLKNLKYRFWDLKSNYEYTNLNEMKNIFPPKDFAMTFSINIVASVTDPFRNRRPEEQK